MTLHVKKLVFANEEKKIVTIKTNKTSNKPAVSDLNAL